MTVFSACKGCLRVLVTEVSVFPVFFQQVDPLGYIYH